MMYNIVKTETHNVGRFEIILDTIEKDNKLSPYSYIKITDGITVIPIIDEQHVLIQKSYRYPLKSWQYEFTSGMIDKGETPEMAAKRELLEETGYSVDKVQDLGMMYPSFGSTDEKIYLFAARCTSKENSSKEPLEQIKTEIMSISQVDQMIKDGQFLHGSGLVAWMKWKMM